VKSRKYIDPVCEITLVLRKWGESIYLLFSEVCEITLYKLNGVIMSTEVYRSNTRSPLLPDRQVQPDFFVCDIFDAAPKGDMASMAHPIFSLSSKRDHKVRRYEDEQGKNYVEVKPSSDGLATIHDRDILIYCISQIMAAMNDGRKVTKIVRLQARDLLKATNRVVDGRGYKGLKAALSRLQGTQIETNIITGGEEQTDIFGIIDRAKIIRETREGKMQELEIHLSDWVFNAIQSNEVLTLHRDYFRLRKPLERRIYEIARKHCGHKREWKITLEVLKRKCGSASTNKEFRRLLKVIVKQDTEHNHMPDYKITLHEDMIYFYNKGTMFEQEIELLKKTPVLLKSETYEEAKFHANGWDVYRIESEWRTWMAQEGLESPEKPDNAFIGFCKKWVKREGRA
jgi:hypothetical protein